ncbi:MAG: hypothetical protein HYX47_05385 [Burkholderiales bacterium]|nr:hypothetical protein [Burkholderiales bacterium]
MRNDVSEPILIPVSAGELFDKLTILEIKRERMSDAGKLANVGREFGLLETVARQVVGAQPGSAAEVARLRGELLKVNQRLWDLENEVRGFGARNDFGPDFAATARQTYSTNDQRSALKRQINALLQSELVEEKEHRIGG